MLDSMTWRGSVWHGQRDGAMGSLCRESQIPSTRSSTGFVLEDKKD